MKKILTMTTILFTTLSYASDIDSLNLKYMYEGAEEVKMLNRSMEAGMREHNQKVQPVVTQTTEHILDKSPIDSFQELDKSFFLEKKVEDSKNTTVQVTVLGDMIKITTSTTKTKHVTTDNGMTQSSYSSNSVEEIPIPLNADATKMTQEYKNGVLKISIPKK